MKFENFRFSWKHFPERGLTTCLISDNEGAPVSAADAVCSHKDQYCRETGRKVSLTKVLRYFKFTREQRAAIWEIYRTMPPKPRWSQPKDKRHHELHTESN